jgi:hypothetical protein
VNEKGLAHWGAVGPKKEIKCLWTKLIVSTSSREFRQTDDKQHWHFVLAQGYSSHDIRA